MLPPRPKAACALTPHPPQSKTWRNFVAATRQRAALLSNASHRRFHKRRYAVLALLLSTIIPQFSSASAQNYSIDWHKIAGGGGVYSVNGTNSVAITPPTGNMFFRLAK